MLIILLILLILLLVDLSRVIKHYRDISLLLVLFMSNVIVLINTI